MPPTTPTRDEIQTWIQNLLELTQHNTWSLTMKFETINVWSQLISNRKCTTFSFCISHDKIYIAFTLCCTALSKKKKKIKALLILKKNYFTILCKFYKCVTASEEILKSILYSPVKKERMKDSVISLSHNYSLLWQKLNNFCNIEMVIKVCRVSQQL